MLLLLFVLLLPLLLLILALQLHDHTGVHPSTHPSGPAGLPHRSIRPSEETAWSDVFDGDAGDRGLEGEAGTTHVDGDDDDGDGVDSHYDDTDGSVTI